MKHDSLKAVPVDMTDEETGEVKHGIWIPDDSGYIGNVRYFYKHSKETFVGLLSHSSDKKMNVLAYLICNKNSDNKIAVTYKKLANGMQMPESTVQLAMKFLQHYDYIRKVQNGLWMINPDLDLKGYESKYLKLCREYGFYEKKFQDQEGDVENDQYERSDETDGK